MFEIVPARAGSQVTLLAGGRYDGLIEAIGGKPTPGIGFGMGIERMANDLRSHGLAPADAAGPAALVVALGAATGPRATALAAELRASGVSATMAFGGRSLKAQLRHANRTGARFALILESGSWRQASCRCATWPAASSAPSGWRRSRGSCRGWRPNPLSIEGSNGGSARSDRRPDDC